MCFRMVHTCARALAYKGVYDTLIEKYSRTMEYKNINIAFTFIVISAGELFLIQVCLFSLI